VVQGSSTVFVKEEELPPPAITRSILAKFRELESTGESKSVPLPRGSGGAGATPSRGTAATNGAYDHPRRDDRPTVNFDSSVNHHGDDDHLFDQRSSNAMNGSTVGQRNGSVSDQPTATVATSPDELPQRGMAKNLLARWRTIEQQAATRGRDETTSAKRTSPARRSQSTSRVEVRQRQRASRVDSDDEGDDRNR
jgi:hypothetical protein